MRVKKWNRDFDDDADPLVKRLEGMRFFLDHDMPKALTYLVQAHRTLESYAETSTPRSTRASRYNTRASAANLVQAVKELSFDWEQTRAYWNDAKSQQFARDYLDQVPEYVMRTRIAMEEIDVLLRKVRSDCE